jgi:hypothetical protein
VERCLHDCFWSADGSQFILYGGQTTGVAALGDAWAFDPAAGDWTGSSDGEAPARQLYALVPTGDGALVFGGSGLDGSFLDDAWQLDPETLALSAVDALPGPSGRAGATLIEDAAGGRQLLFGGLGEDGPFADVWELTTP